MAFTYTFNPDASTRDAVRLLIGDTDECDALLQDKEIDYFLEQYNNAPINAAIRACETIISKLARRPDEKVGNVSISYSQQAKGYRDLLMDLKIRLASEDATPYAGGISRADKLAQRANGDRVPPKFTKNMMEDKLVSPYSDQNPFDADIPGSEETGG